jgi:hypothetical protein
MEILCSADFRRLSLQFLNIKITMKVLEIAKKTVHFSTIADHSGKDKR